MNAWEMFENSGEFRFRDLTKLEFPRTPKVVRVRTLVTKVAQYAVSAPRCGTAKKRAPAALSNISCQCSERSLARMSAWLE